MQVIARSLVMPVERTTGVASRDVMGVSCHSFPHGAFTFARDLHDSSYLIELCRRTSVVPFNTLCITTRYCTVYVHGIYEDIVLRNEP